MVVKELAYALLTAWGVEKAMKLAQMEQRKRRLIASVAFAGMLFNFPNAYEPGPGNFTFKWTLATLSDNQLRRLTFLLVGMYFMYRLDATPQNVWFVDRPRLRGWD
jgi:hypothetical protein